MAWTSDVLLTSVRRRAFRPATDASLTDTDLLSIADEEIASYMVPLTMSSQNEYMVASQDFVVTTGLTNYRIPYRAIDGKLRDVIFVDINGNVWSVPELDPARLDRYNRGNGVQGFYIKNNDLVLVPAPVTVGASLRLSFYLRPNTLVTNTTGSSGNYAVISAISGNTITTAATVPSGWSTATKFDALKATPGFETRGFDLAASVVSGTTITFTAAPDQYLAVGDYICAAGTTPVPQLPAEFHPVLYQRVAVRMLEYLGDSRMGSATQELERLTASLIQSISPRVDGEPQLLVNDRGVWGWNLPRRGWGIL